MIGNAIPLKRLFLWYILSLIAWLIFNSATVCLWFFNFSLILCLQYAKIIEFVVMVMTQFQYQWGQLAFISGAPKNTTMR